MTRTYRYPFRPLADDVPEGRLTTWKLPPSPLEKQKGERATEKLLAALFPKGVMARLFPKKTEVPEVLLAPVTQFEKDSGVLPPLSETALDLLGNLPALPFEGRLKAGLQGRFEEALPPMPWEGK